MHKRGLIAAQRMENRLALLHFYILRFMKNCSALFLSPHTPRSLQLIFILLKIWCSQEQNSGAPWTEIYASPCSCITITE